MKNMRGQEVRQDNTSALEMSSCLPMTILSASRNRHPNLLQALDTWLPLNASQIILVDYGSTEPLADYWSRIGRVLPERVEIVRAEGPQRWDLPIAFNSALDRALQPWILKLDADHAVSDHGATAICSHLSGGDQVFFHGSYQSTAPGQAHVHGAVLAPTDSLRKIGGWDSRLQVYGWDDSDLYERLALLGLREEHFAEGVILHLPHSDLLRALDLDEDVVAPRGKILRALTSANKAMSQADVPFRGNLGCGPDNSIMGPGRPLSPSQRLSIGLIEFARRLQEQPGAEGIWRSRIKRVATFTRQQMSSKAKSLMLRAMTLFGKQPKIVIVQPAHGLGNRLRALASGLSFSRKIGASFFLDWVPDEHCEASFDDLFQSQINQAIPEEIHTKAKCVQLSGLKNLQWFHFWGADVIRIVSSNSFDFFPDQRQFSARFLRSLQPTNEVQALIAEVEKPPYVGFHLRQVGGPKWEHLPWEAPSNWSAREHQLIGQKRDLGRPENFQALAYFLNRHNLPPGAVFVASDTVEGKEMMLNLIGPSCTARHTSELQRSPEAIKEALADLIILSQARVLLSGDYSSFSEVANLMAGPDQVWVRVNGPV